MTSFDIFSMTIRSIVTTLINSYEQLKCHAQLS